MSSFYDSVGEEPTYELAESIIKFIIQGIKRDSNYYDTSPNTSGYTQLSTVHLEFIRVDIFTLSIRVEMINALQIIIKHFPDTLMQNGNAIYVKDGTKHLLNTDDVLVMDYYLFLLSEYEERVNKYQQYLKKQQDRQHNKLLLIFFLPLIMVICMFLVGDL
ncbi:MAG: hypothetical protein RR575_00050 [Acinetobacter sp.]